MKGKYITRKKEYVMNCYKLLSKKFAFCFKVNYYFVIHFIVRSIEELVIDEHGLLAKMVCFELKDAR